MIWATKRMPDLAEIEAFLYLEARLLDERRFAEWLELFTADCTYWVPASWGQTSAIEEVSLFYDDHLALQARIGRLMHPRAHAQLPPSRTVHGISNIRLAASHADTREQTVQSVLQFHEFRAPDSTHLVGLVEHVLRFDGTTLRIARKRVDLINCDQALRSLQIPL